MKTLDHPEKDIDLPRGNFSCDAERNALGYAENKVGPSTRVAVYSFLDAVRLSWPEVLAQPTLGRFEATDTIYYWDNHYIQLHVIVYKEELT